MRGTARLLDLLARDRRYLHFLRANALETARAWPSWEQSSTFMAAALRAIVRLPPPALRGPGTLLAPEAQAAAAAMGMEIGALNRELTELPVAEAPRLLPRAAAACRAATPAARPRAAWPFGAPP